MAADDNFDNPWIIILYIVLAAVIILAFGGAIGIIILALKSSISLASLSWALPATTIAISISAITYVGSSVKKIKQDPYYWMLPLLSIVSAVVIEFCKEYYPFGDHESVKIIFEGVVASVYFLAGITWKCEKKVVGKGKYYGRKIIAFVLFLIPPMLTFISYVHANHKIQLDNLTPIAILIGLFLIIILFSWLMRDKKE